MQKHLLKHSKCFSCIKTRSNHCKPMNIASRASKMFQGCENRLKKHTSSFLICHFLIFFFLIYIFSILPSFTSFTVSFFCLFPFLPNFYLPYSSSLITFLSLLFIPYFSIPFLQLFLSYHPLLSFFT